MISESIVDVSPKTDDTVYARAILDLDNIMRQVKDASILRQRLHKGLAQRFSEMGDKGAACAAHMAHLDALCLERDYTLAQFRYAWNYRWALRKAGVKAEEVAQTFTRQISKPGQLTKVVLSELDLRDGRRVKIEPVEIPRELLRSRPSMCS